MTFLSIQTPYKDDLTRFTRLNETSTHQNTSKLELVSIFDFTDRNEDGSTTSCNCCTSKIHTCYESAILSIVTVWV